MIADGRTLKKYEFWQNIDVDAIMKEGCFISGGRGSGKSTLSFWIGKKLMMNGVYVKVLDGSLVWRRKSAIPYYQTLRNCSSKVADLYNCIYDFSRLSCFEMREYVTGLMEYELNRAIELTEEGYNPQVCYILEECQNLCPSGSLRSSDYQEISRFITQGRNFGLSYIGLTQRLASVDTNLVEISGVKYFGKTEGDNNLRKVKSWIGKENIETVRGLNVGKFLRQHGNEIKLIKSEIFESYSKPVKFIRPQPIRYARPIERPQPQPFIRYPTRQPTLNQRFNNWALERLQEMGIVKVIK